MTSFRQFGSVRSEDKLRVRVRVSDAGIRSGLRGVELDKFGLRVQLRTVGFGG